MTTTHRIVVLGAGYTGMMAAVRLARRTRKLDVKITLVNPSTRFTERLRMHQVAAGQELADNRIPEILAGSASNSSRAGRVPSIPRRSGSTSTAPPHCTTTNSSTPSAAAPTPALCPAPPITAGP